MSTTMKALMLRGVWSPRGTGPSPANHRAANANFAWKDPSLEVISSPVPQIHDDEVLIRVRACGICGTDTHCCHPDAEGYVPFSGPLALPVIPGHEFAGEIVDAGKNVRGLKVGDAVASESIRWCGHCDACRAGNPNQCQRVELTGLTVPGAFAEFIAVDPRYCWPLASLRDAYPDEQSMYEVGALIEPLGCAYNGLFIAGGGFAPGAVVAIHGAGPIGLSAIMLARAAGASKVLAFDVSAGRLDLARRLGADLAADPAELKAQGTSVYEYIRHLTGGHGADMQVEAAGAADETVPQMIASAAANGKMIYLGRAANSAQIDFNTMVSGATQITGSRGHSGHGIYPSIIRLLAAGRLPAHQMIARRFSLDRVIEALALSKDAGEGKVMVGGRMGNQNDETRNQNENLEI